MKARKMKAAILILLSLAIVGSIVAATWQPATDPREPIEARLEQLVKRLELIVDGRAD